MLLRIEDIDEERCRPEYTQLIFEDLRWLGLSWPEPVRIQSEHLSAHRSAAKWLWDQGFAYPCFLSRAEIQSELERLESVAMGPEGPLYPGTHRDLPPQEVLRRIEQGQPYNLRLNATKAARAVGSLHWQEGDKTVPVQPDISGDIVIARKGIGTSYHLSVVLDDHEQGVDLVTRGQDLYASTHVQRVLQALLGLRVPRYHHHSLITDEQGEKLSKGKCSTPIRDLRAAGWSPLDVWSAIGVANG